KSTTGQYGLGQITMVQTHFLPGLHIGGNTYERNFQLTKILYVLNVIKQAYEFVINTLSPGKGLGNGNLKPFKWQGKRIPFRILLFVKGLGPSGHIVLDQGHEIGAPKYGIEFRSGISGGIERPDNGPHT